MKPPRITVAACSLCFLSTALTPSAMADPEDQKWGAESKGSTVDVTKSRSVEVPQGSGAGTGGGGEAAQGPVGGSEGAVAERRPLACLAQGDCGAVLGAAVGAARSRSPQQPAGGGGVVVVTAAEAQRIVAAGSGLVRQPPGPEALVSKVVIVYTSPSRQVIDTQVGGSPVRVVATPISYTWDWGGRDHDHHHRPRGSLPRSHGVPQVHLHRHRGRHHPDHHLAGHLRRRRRPTPSRQRNPDHHQHLHPLRSGAPGDLPDRPGRRSPRPLRGRPGRGPGAGGEQGWSAGWRSESVAR